jgi:glycosyltransferase involved in cell wall biosynthesis
MASVEDPGHDHAGALTAVRRAVRLALRTVSAAIALPLLVLSAVLARRTASDPRTGAKPRLAYGPVPIISIKYLSRAMQRMGYETVTAVEERYAIHGDGDFDVEIPRQLRNRSDLPALARLVAPLGIDYAALAWTMTRFDVFHCFFDGGFLRRTPLRFLEVQLLHLARRRVVVVPYGSDVAVPSQMRSLAWRDGLLRNYPHLGKRETVTRRWIDYFSRRADYIVGCVVHSETLPRWDLLTTHYYPIDTDEWRYVASAESGHDGRTGPVVVVHAPNHRGAKGTDHLIVACDELRREGLQVELRLLEGVPNVEVRRAMAAADVVAEQFLLGYALTAMEAMSLGKPVMSNLSEPGYYDVHRLTTGLAACPIVDTSPHQIRDHLRALIVDPGLRRRLGEAGRRYVIEYHSLEAMGRLWEAIYRRVWAGDPIDPRTALPGVTAP